MTLSCIPSKGPALSHRCPGTSVDWRPRAAGRPETSDPFETGSKWEQVPAESSTESPGARLVPPGSPVGGMSWSLWAGAPAGKWISRCAVPGESCLCSGPSGYSTDGSTGAALRWRSDVRSFWHLWDLIEGKKSVRAFWSLFATSKELKNKTKWYVLCIICWLAS